MHRLIATVLTRHMVHRCPGAITISPFGPKEGVVLGSYTVIKTNSAVQT